MNVLLVFNNGSDKDLKVMVRLHTQTLRNRVKALVKENKEKEAFYLIFAEAMVEKYIPPGGKYEFKPELTLVEDLL